MMATLFFPPEDSPRSYAEHFEIKKWMIFTSAAISLFLLGFREIVIQREYVLGRNAIRVTGIVVLLGIVFLEKVLRVTWAIYAEWSALISCSVLLAVFIGVYRFRGVPS